MLQVQRANREELGRTCPHRPGGGWLPWKGLSQPHSGAGKVPGRLGLHSQPLPRMKANRALNPNLNAARFPPSIPSPPCCQARTRAGHQASLTHCLALRAEAPRTNTVAVRGPRVPQTTRGVKSLPRGSPSGSAKSCPLSELASAQSLSCTPPPIKNPVSQAAGGERPDPCQGGARAGDSLSPVVLPRHARCFFSWINPVLRTPSPHFPPRAASLPTTHKALHPPGVPQAAPGPLPHRSQLAALPPPLQTHPSPGRAAWPGGVGCVTRMRTRPFTRTCVSAPGASEPSTHLCERCDSVRFPDAGNAPGSSARVPTSGLAATDYSCVCPALGGSASWEAAHGLGARAPRCPRLPPTAWGSSGRGCS